MDHHMHMGSGMPDPSYLQKMYWAVVGSLLGAATLVNVLNQYLAFQRLRDSTLTPSKPKSTFFSAYASVTALVREASHATAPPVSIRGQTFHFAPLGPLAIILANLLVVVVLCFYKLDTRDQWAWEDIGYRTGFITIAQLPLIYLLSGRQNIIGFLSGIDYQRLNWLHRWTARTVWLCATFHMGFWFRSWGRYNYIVNQLHNNGFAKRGFAAWCILTFIVFSSGRPIRRLGYEFFVLQHLVMFVGFTVAVWLHASPETKVWVWISIGLLVFDRTLRYIRGAYLNLSIFHGSSWSSHAWANRASFTPLPGNVTRVTIQNPRTSWAAGQHIFLTCHSIAPFQSHPFTIASIPEDNKMEFFIHAEKGATRRIFRYASKHDAILGNSIPSAERQTRTVFLEGPYGSLRPLRQFDSIVLIAGGMGATFTTPLLRDIVARWRSGTQSAQRTVTKRIRFIWVIRSRAHLVWFEAQLQSALVEVEARRRANPDWIHEIEIGVYLTCDEAMDSPSSTPCLSRPGGQSPLPETTAPDTEKSAGENKDIQATEKSNRPACCCTTTIDAETQANPPPEIQCTCSGPASLQSRSPPTPMPIALQPGRPALRPLIRQTLEKAEGESAVVVCGPVGLAEDVRHSVVYLSDERAVHKGTGAQGIYLHVEMFGW